jgi:hypothetical protein
MATKEEFLKLAETKYEEIAKLKGTPSFYDYEKAFDEIWTEFGRKAFEQSISEVPLDRRKKNAK